MCSNVLDEYMSLIIGTSRYYSIVVGEDSMNEKPLIKIFRNNELSKNPCCQNSYKGSKGYPECPLSPFERFSLVISHRRNSLESTPICASVKFNTFVTDFLNWLIPIVKAWELFLIANKCLIVNMTTIPSFIIKSPFTVGRRNGSSFPFAKIGTTNTGMLGQFHRGIIPHVGEPKYA